MGTTGLSSHGMVHGVPGNLQGHSSKWKGKKLPAINSCLSSDDGQLFKLNIYSVILIRSEYERPCPNFCIPTRSVRKGCWIPFPVWYILFEASAFCL